jgi:hypothetical protein
MALSHSHIISSIEEDTEVLHGIEKNDDVADHEYSDTFDSDVEEVDGISNNGNVAVASRPIDVRMEDEYKKGGMDLRLSDDITPLVKNVTISDVVSQAPPAKDDAIHQISAKDDNINQLPANDDNGNQITSTEETINHIETYHLNQLSVKEGAVENSLSVLPNSHTASDVDKLTASSENRVPELQRIVSNVAQIDSNKQEQETPMNTEANEKSNSDLINHSIVPMIVPNVPSPSAIPPAAASSLTIPEQTASFNKSESFTEFLEAQMNSEKSSSAISSSKPIETKSTPSSKKLPTTSATAKKMKAKDPIKKAALDRVNRINMSKLSKPSPYPTTTTSQPPPPPRNASKSPSPRTPRSTSPVKGVSSRLYQSPPPPPPAIPKSPSALRVSDIQPWGFGSTGGSTLGSKSSGAVSWIDRPSDGVITQPRRKSKSLERPSSQTASLGSTNSRPLSSLSSSGMGLSSLKSPVNAAASLSYGADAEREREREMEAKIKSLELHVQSLTESNVALVKELQEKKAEMAVIVSVGETLAGTYVSGPTGPVSKDAEGLRKEVRELEVLVAGVSIICNFFWKRLMNV